MKSELSQINMKSELLLVKPYFSVFISRIYKSNNKGVRQDKLTGAIMVKMFWEQLPASVCI